MDGLKSTLRTLAEGKRPEAGVMHCLNFSQKEASEYLGMLQRSGLVTEEESGLYSITSKGRSLLNKWDEIDVSILKGR